ncbi:MAG: CDP-alcohol phosphatidyltransferase family protein [Beijerinckiaceae bacterium]
MLDGVARQAIDPFLNRIASGLASRQVAPNSITLFGCAAGCVAAALIAAQAPAWSALLVLLVSRLADGLDGAVARASGRVSDWGGFLDIVLDFLFYGAIPLAFALRAPEANALPAAVLLFAFCINGASFLAFAAIAARRSGEKASPSARSLVFSVGLAEATETFAVFAAMIVWPAAFPWLAYGFAAICGLSALLRIGLARQTFR